MAVIRDAVVVPLVAVARPAITRLCSGQPPLRSWYLSVSQICSGLRPVRCCALKAHKVNILSRYSSTTLVLCIQ
ncbi:hypothetical protein DTO027B5_1181 [Paecilomyces variotii]|nr:hypothetical protein DTO169C6_7769 [Paecilomyces variotii]KAJ9267964.1 hypothetical protein DTO195F2_298 [Paecilomyces variotii]KAJ9288970.1 hypothetical protein DTO021C3_3495 [Paecilomyces variotii]KAJ9324043.1 hypothetical protein DTO027B3_4859 [Paecilomyces variotii]KAJ9337007.1 hypothetical protein DTO027B5_1181 [Paecilomyces variotii]